MSSATAPSAAHRDRFERTLAFVRAGLPPPARLLDVGPDNALARELRAAGYAVENTGGADLDDRPEAAGAPADALIAFEVLEHLVNPLGVLRASPARRLFATVPRRLWFAPAYRSATDPRDRHFHEFEDWQFDWLLEKAGWEVVRRERWRPASSGLPLGVRPALRRVTPRWYAVEGRRP
ncbi:hypothetical protein RQM47_06215 [Rubrivirga sp. S365]|uniref:methyltransferase domain-containing protein n=1 Tax=Rubrivirga sp. S365 TaxID=3076080 RepID=UPI0028C8076E|nr:methyltransferase domain-containing protein [Rubrivirga sp. S365]MDT7856227.1 hypothetical protein [Rubrivirga sp. S365]